MPKAVKWEEGSEKYEGAVEATWMGEGIMDMRKKEPRMRNGWARSWEKVSTRPVMD